jgi:hypothetical protein
VDLRILCTNCLNSCPLCGRIGVDSSDFVDDLVQEWIHCSSVLMVTVWGLLKFKMVLHYHDLIEWFKVSYAVFFMGLPLTKNNNY